MSQINLCEVYYKTIRLLGKEAARKFLDAFQLLPITVIHPTDEIIWKAAEIKADQPISLSDCFATATALEKEAVVITGDPDFRKIEHIIPTEWM
ncbi:MAG: type II toxin-antitoxin system VapC family toxin [bacterium]